MIVGLQIPRYQGRDFKSRPASLLNIIAYQEALSNSGNPSNNQSLKQIVQTYI